MRYVCFCCNNMFRTIHCDFQREIASRDTRIRELEHAHEVCVLCTWRCVYTGDVQVLRRRLADAEAPAAVHHDATVAVRTYALHLRHVAEVLASARADIDVTRRGLDLADGTPMDAFEVLERLGRRSVPVVGSRCVAVARGIVVARDRVCGRYYGVCGAVFRARHIATGAIVALKVMCVACTDSPRAHHRYRDAGMCTSKAPVETSARKHCAASSAATSSCCFPARGCMNRPPTAPLRSQRRMWRAFWQCSPRF